MSIQSASQLSFGFWQGRTVQIEQVDENISSDGGLIAFKQLDSILGWTESFSELIQHSGRDHSAKSMLQQRVFGIVAGYEDQNDHDSLRSDPIFKLIAGRSPSDPDLASQPTLSRFENSVTPSNLLQMEEWFLDRFVESFSEAPERITLDMDTFDDPTHGMQQLTFFHGYYDQYQYQVRVITCAENDMTVLPVLLYGTAAVSLGAYDDIVRVIQKIRARFPDTIIEFRADAGFAVPRMYEALEAIPNVIYTIGFAMSPVLRKKSDELLKSTELHTKRQVNVPSSTCYFRIALEAGETCREILLSSAKPIAKEAIDVLSSRIALVLINIQTGLTNDTPIVERARTVTKN